MKIKNIFIRAKVVTFEMNEKLVFYSSDIGFKHIKNLIAHDVESIHFMLHRKYIANEEYKILTQKDEYECLYIKDDEVKGDNITDANESKMDYAIDFVSCKSILSKRGEC